MKAKPTFLLFLAATSLAFVSQVHAQLQTFETQTGYAGSVSTFGVSGAASRKAQVFTDVLSVATISYNFFAGSGGSPLGTTQSADFTAQFGEWNGSSLVSTLVDFGAFTVPPSTLVGPGLWSSTLSETGASFANFSQTFDFTSLGGADPLLGYALDPTKNYALLLTLTNGTLSTNIGLGVNDSDYYLELDEQPLLFSNGYFGSPTSGNDYVFSQINIVPNPTIPESSTVAALLGVALVAGLVSYRIRQRRQLGPSAVATIA